MSDLSISVPDLDNPFRKLITDFLATEIPANLNDKNAVLEALTAAIVATNQIRFGPSPSPESLVLIRQVIRKAMDANKPIPFMVPWGSKKPDNKSIDIAEVYGLKMLSCLNKRVKLYYAPGIQVSLRIEDTSGYVLFEHEGPAVIEASKQYVSDLVKLVRIMGYDSFVTPFLESDYITVETFKATADPIRDALIAYLEESNAKGLDGYESLESWKRLAAMGWQGNIPQEQRDFYRDRYIKWYPQITTMALTFVMATYFAGALTRYKLGITGVLTEWEGSYIQINFVPPVPGTPESLAGRKVFYRTVTMNHARTHIPAWRAKGYLKIVNSTITPKLANFSEPLDLIPCMVKFERDGESVWVRADHTIE